MAEGQRLREVLSQWLGDRLLTLAMRLLGAEELPRVQLPPPKPLPKVCNCLECREQRLGRLFMLDGFLAYALRTCRWVGHDVDQRFKQ